jgi:hypothetical protein
MSELPEKIIITDGQPALALFYDPNESFALGREIAKLWEPVCPTEKVSRGTYSLRKRNFPVRADLAKGRDIGAYQARGEPGCLVVQWRDGTSVRHYLNSTKFLTAVGVQRLKAITAAELHALAPNRGRNFYFRQPPPEEVPEETPEDTPDETPLPAISYITTREAGSIGLRERLAKNHHQSRAIIVTVQWRSFHDPNSTYTEVYIAPQQEVWLGWNDPFQGITNARFA